jgi:RNA polymerase sigma-70 factor, ECF subfamily
VTAAAAALERAYRDERPSVLATLTRKLDGDLALAEDVVQDAFVAAAVDRDRRGVPDRAGAWLTTMAWRKALDRLRRDRVAAARAPDLAAPVSYDLEVGFERSSLGGDQLRMLFTCCHPALNPEARMALTLRSVAGLTVPEIARAFLSTESAMERRLVRARRKVTDARIPFRIPSDKLLAERLAGVLRVVYLVYTEGHVATHGDPPVRGELCEEAIRLARLLARLMPDEAETLGLLAPLLTDARRPARVNADGAFASLEDRTARAGMPARSRRVPQRSTARCGSGGRAHTSSRQRSRRSMRTPRPGRRPTGRRSPGCTPSWRGSSPRRSSRSTARSPSDSRTARPRAWRSSTASPRTSA